jgi:hypothetical protein
MLVRVVICHLSFVMCALQLCGHYPPLVKFYASNRTAMLAAIVVPKIESQEAKD